MKYPIKVLNETKPKHAVWVLCDLKDGSVDLRQLFASKIEADVVVAKERETFWWYLARLQVVA